MEHPRRRIGARKLWTLVAAVMVVAAQTAAFGSAGTWDPVAAGQPVHAIRMVDAVRGWAVGPGGLVMATADGGVTWVRQPAPTAEPLAAVAAVDSQRVWVAGGRGTILRSTDGGVTWADQPTSAPNEFITGLAFPTATLGFATTESGSLLSTSDGGATWRGGPGDRLESYWGIDFANATHGIVVGSTTWDENVVLRTSNGGASWTRSVSKPVRPAGLFAVDMVSATEAYAGSREHVFRTTDGGATWEYHSVGSNNLAARTLTGISVTAGGVGWAVSAETDRVYRTTDHGASWTQLSPPPSGNLHAVAAIDATHALVGAGGASVLRTTDGTTWTRQDASLSWVPDDLLAVDLSDALHAWAVGRNGTIVATSDGGATWARQPSGTTSDLRSVDFVDAAEGWAVGGEVTPDEPSLVLHTTDGGATWTALPILPMSAYPTVVRFTDSDHGYIGSRSGVYATTDGGATWTGLMGSSPASDLDFPTPSVGYVATGGSVEKTTDGGATWTTVMPYGQPYTGQHTYVDFVDAQTGWVDGQYWTTDGGATWTKVADPGTYGDIAFLDATHGVSAGPGGVTRTIDSGAHWRLVQGAFTGPWEVPFQSWHLRAIAFADPTHGFAVGDDGLILRAPTREQVFATIEASSPAGTTVSLTASVTRVEAFAEFDTGDTYPSSSLPSGTVTFRDHGTAIATVPVGSDGRAVLSRAWSADVHSFSVTYAGDAVYAPERSGAVVVDLTPPPPTTTTTTVPPATPPTPANLRRTGYWMIARSGDVYAFGDAGWWGNAPSGGTTADLEPSASGRGYWVATSGGSVRALGDAPFLGDAGPLSTGEEVTSLSRTPSGNGYWLFTTRGRVLARGDASFLGDLSGTRLNGPVLDSVPAPDGRGYYMVASDGGVFAFGTARFRGSMGATRLNAPVQSLVPDADGSGYWLVASDGGIFAFDAAFHGSMGAARLNRPVTGMVGSTTGAGYLMVAEDGGIFAFGDVAFRGSLGSNPPPSPVVAVAAVP